MSTALESPEPLGPVGLAREIPSSYAASHLIQTIQSRHVLCSEIQRLHTRAFFSAVVSFLCTLSLKIRATCIGRSATSDSSATLPATVRQDGVTGLILPRRRLLVYKLHVMFSRVTATQNKQSELQDITIAGRGQLALPSLQAAPTSIASLTPFCI